MGDSQQILDPSMPEECCPSLDAPNRYQNLVRALEQLLSDQNLDCDKELRWVRAASEGWLDLSQLLDHPTMKKLAVRHKAAIDGTELCRWLVSSTHLEVSGSNVRRVVPYVPQEQKDHRRDELNEQTIFFPVMSAEELLHISVSAAAPASKLREVFSLHGCALVTHVLDASQCAELEDLWKDDLLELVDEHVPATNFVQETLQQVRLQGASAWPSIWKGPLGSKGCASQRNLPHGRFAWAARLQPQVRQVFANLYDVSPEELCVGMDTVFWAAADTAGPVTENKQWLHVDQNFRAGLTHLCAQGVLYIWPSIAENASTTAVWPGSHLDTYNLIMHDQHAVEQGKKKAHSVRINNLSNYSLRDVLAAEAVAGTRRVPCPPGSLLLWDSRTIHQGWAGGPRLAQPVCWEPKFRRDEAARRRKLWCCASGVPTSHSSSEGRVHGMARPGRPGELEPTQVKPAMKLTMPHCIEPSQAQTWESLQDMLWVKARPTANSRRLTPEQAPTIEAILNQEVLNAL